MHDFPHHYVVSAESNQQGEVTVKSDGLETIPTMPPAEFGGPGDLWSPETLLVASVANCLILTFRAVARANRFEWNSISCEVEGVLDRVERSMRFTEYHVRVTLHVPGDSDVEKAERLVQRSEHGCLITQSLNGDTHLTTEVVVAA
ncbi:MAG TPA: OsmC family protein [Xanthomonadales bacterium]|nr:OsmC family protein [Xanthomonadales bacterium]